MEHMVKVMSLIVMFALGPSLGDRTGREFFSPPATSLNRTPPPLSATPPLLPSNCDCPHTKQYDPVCGSDGNTYFNQGNLQCFRRCGSSVVPVSRGTCITTTG